MRKASIAVRRLDIIDYIHIYIFTLDFSHEIELYLKNKKKGATLRNE